MLQRDYAQGRLKEPHKPMSSDNLILSSKFAYNIIETVLVKNKELGLDFIYGLNEAESFEPIDGQQRLTTLWLIHWYAMCSLGMKRTYMENFTYETRVSSRDFIKCLYNNTIELNYLLFKENQINTSEYERKFLITIQEQKWFHHFWRQDATIVAMLNMLDYVNHVLLNSGIHKLSNEHLEQLENKITFRVVSMDKHGLDDSLYVKMNARGKNLTPFENFKADLLGYIKKFSEVSGDVKLYRDFSKKLDNDWLDIFWNAAKNKKNEQKTAFMDKNYFSFVNRFVINRWYLLNYKEKHSISRSGESYDRFDDYEKILGENATEILSDLANTLDSIYLLIDAENKFDFSFCPGKSNIERSLLLCSNNNYKEQCMEYAFCVFLKHWKPIKKNGKKDVKLFKQDFLEWKKFIWSLLSFRYIGDESSCRSFIAVIDKLLHNIELEVENHSLLDILSDMNVPLTVDIENSDEINYYLRIEKAKAHIRKNAADQEYTDEDILHKAEILFVDGKESSGTSALSENRRYVDLSFIIDYAMRQENEPMQIIRFSSEWLANLNDILKDEVRKKKFYNKLKDALDKGCECYNSIVKQPRETVSKLISMGWEPVRGRVNNSLRCLCCSAAEFDFALFLQNRYKMDAGSRDYLGELLGKVIDSEQVNPDIPVWKKFLITHCKYSEDYDMFRWCRAGYIGFFRDDKEIWYDSGIDTPENPLHLILNSATKWSYHIDAGLHYLVYNLDNEIYKWSCKTHAIVHISTKEDKLVATLKSINSPNTKWVYQVSFENGSNELDDTIKTNLIEYLRKRQEKCNDCIEEIKLDAM